LNFLAFKSRNYTNVHLRFMVGVGWAYTCSSIFVLVWPAHLIASMIRKVDYNLSKISSKKYIICEDGKFQNLLTKTCEASLVMSFTTVIVSQIKCPKKPIFTNLKKRFERIELPAKLLDYFLRSNKSNINQ